MGDLEGVFAAGQGAGNQLHSVVVDDIGVNAGILCGPALGNRQRHGALTGIGLAINSGSHVIGDVCFCVKGKARSNFLHFHRCLLALGASHRNGDTRGIIRGGQLYLTGEVVGVALGHGGDQVIDLVLAICPTLGRAIAPAAQNAANNGYLLVCNILGLGNRRILDSFQGILVTPLALGPDIIQVIAQHIVPRIIVVENLEASIVQFGHGCIVCALRPIADHNILVKRNGGCLSGIKKTIIIGQRGHFGILDHLGNFIDILCEGCVLRIAQAAEAILVRCKVIILAALGRKIRDVLLLECLDKLNLRIGGQAHLGIGSLSANAQLIHGADQRIHVARRIEHGDDGNVFALGIGNNGVHVSLGQHRAGSILTVTVRGVAISDSIFHIIAAICLVVGLHRHIVQQEPETVVAEGQLQVREVIFCQLIDDALDLTDGEILSAAVQVENAQELAVLGRGLVLARLGAGRGGECGDGQQPDHQNHRQNQRQQSLPRRSCLRLVHFVHSFPLYVIFHCPVRGAAETSPARFQAL